MMDEHPIVLAAQDQRDRQHRGRWRSADLGRSHHQDRGRVHFGAGLNRQEHLEQVQDRAAPDAVRL